MGARGEGGKIVGGRRGETLILVSIKGSRGKTFLEITGGGGIGRCPRQRWVGEGEGGQFRGTR